MFLFYDAYDKFNRKTTNVHARMTVLNDVSRLFREQYLLIFSSFLYQRHVYLKQLITLFIYLFLLYFGENPRF